MFPPSSKIPLIMHHQRHPSSWTSLPAPLFHQHHLLHRGLPCPTEDHDPFHLPPTTSTPSPSLSSHGGLFKRVVHGSDPFGIHVETGKITDQEMVYAKAVTASKSHSEAERRRRERINNHLTRLRSLLPSTNKTDKASLLAEVIQHVKELKRQTSILAEQSYLIPTEKDELTVHNTSDAEGRIVIRASLCCDDRSDLLPDLIKTLKMLRLRTLKSEIATLGRRVKNVLFVTGEEDHESSNNNEEMVAYWINTIEEALKAVVEKRENEDDSWFGSFKRQRTNDAGLFN